MFLPALHSMQHSEVSKQSKKITTFHHERNERSELVARKHGLPYLPACYSQSGKFSVENGKRTPANAAGTARRSCS